MRTNAMILSAALVGMLAVGCSKDEPKPAPPATPTTAAAPAAAPQADAPAKKADLIIWADADPDTGEAPLTVKFSADPLEEIQNPTYTWNFGDGSPEVAGGEATHTYTKPGTYTATLTARDSTGNSGTDQTQIDVEEPEK